MPKVLMTFDLKGAEPDDYEPGYEALVHLGLSRLSAQKKLRLPYSSVLGETNVGNNAREICNALKKELEKATGREVERIVVALVSDWACDGKVDQDLYLQEIISRFEAAVIRLSP